MMVLQEGFFGMLPVSKAKFGTLQKFGMGWSRNLKYAGATCNGLVMKGKNSVIGDALEKQLFRAVEAQYVVSRRCLDLPKTSPQCRKRVFTVPTRFRGLISTVGMTFLNHLDVSGLRRAVASSPHVSTSGDRLSLNHACIICLSQLSGVQL